jgi:glycosyltransferase involved in cell wall biosynthesis
MSPARVLVFTTVFPSPQNPQRGVFTLNLARALSQAGHAVSALVPVSITSGLRAARRTSARRIVRGAGDSAWMDAQRSSVTHLHWLSVPKAVAGFHAYRGFELQRGRAFRHAVERFRPDVVLAPWLPDALTVLRAARRNATPVVALAIGGDVHTWPDVYRAWAPAARRLSEDAAAHVFVSEALRLDGADRGLHGRLVRVIPLPIDTALFSPGATQPSAGPVRVLAVGHLEHVKGHDVLIEAFHRLAKQTPNAALRIVGAGSRKADLAAAVTRLRLADRICFLDPMSQHALVTEYRQATVLAMPSRAEGLPNTVLEALSCGTPVVASAVGGIPEVVSGEVGALVPPDDPEALATALASALRRGWEHDQVRNAVAGRFGFGQIAQRFEELFDEVLATGATRRTSVPIAPVETPPGSIPRLAAPE